MVGDVMVLCILQVAVDQEIIPEEHQNEQQHDNNRESFIGEVKP